MSSPSQTQKIVTCKLMGGLGNQMFQIAATLGFADKNPGYIPVFPPQTDQNCSRKKSYADNILSKIERRVLQPTTATFNVHSEPHFQYHPIRNSDSTKNLFLFGYFQSYRYFEDSRQCIFDTFEPDMNTKMYMKQKYNVFDNECNIVRVAIHVRRGDYLNLQHYHYVQPEIYYQNAIDRMKHELEFQNERSDIHPPYQQQVVEFLVFSDDISWCKQSTVFKELQKEHPIQFIENEEDYIELHLMSCCDHQIIANSSFSWWGAYLNRNREKIVIAPTKWFHPSTNLNWKDIYHPNWIQVKSDTLDTTTDTEEQNVAGKD